MEVIHEYKRFGYRVTLYANRIEIDQKKGYMPGTKDTILLRSVVNVALSPFSKELTLSLTDGSQRKVLVYGKDAERLRLAILGAIP